MFRKHNISSSKTSEKSKAISNNPLSTNSHRNVKSAEDKSILLNPNLYMVDVSTKDDIRKQTWDPPSLEKHGEWLYPEKEYEYFSDMPDTEPNAKSETEYEYECDIPYRQQCCCRCRCCCCCCCHHRQRCCCCCSRFRNGNLAPTYSRNQPSKERRSSKSSKFSESNKTKVRNIQRTSKSLKKKSKR